MSCVFRIRFNHLASIWYTVIFVIIQLYLLYLALNRYKLYTEIKWPNGAYPHIWLTIYVSLFAVCIPLLVLFVASGIWKSGNLAGDNDQIGLRSKRIIELSRHKVQAQKKNCSLYFCHSIKSCWQHSPPFPQTIHLILALCQLFAQQIMLSQLYRYGFINSGDFLNTELDFIFHRSRQLITNLPIGDTRLQGFHITSEELTNSPIAPNLLPILMHARLFGIPLEFVNFVVALIAYSCAYPSVFWRLSKGFSFCFTTYLIIYSVTLIWTYLSFSILFRIQETNYYSARPVGIDQYLWALKRFQVYHPLGIICTFLGSILFMHVSSIIFYSYGYNKYVISVERYRHAARQSLPQNINTSPTNMFITNNKIDCSAQNRLCCDGFGPHISAIFILMFIVSVKAPSLYALTLFYQHSEKPLILSCIVVDVIYLFTWIIVWLALTLKRDWDFHVIHNVCEILSLQDARRTAHGSLHEKSIIDLKNSLLLMHRENLFVTDDLSAKSVIMRYFLKTYNHDDAYWLKSNQSPVNHHIPLEDLNCTWNRSKNSAEVGRLLKETTCGSYYIESHGNFDNNTLQNVSLAALPYHQKMPLLLPTVNDFPLQQPCNEKSSAQIVNSSPSCQQYSIDQTNLKSYASIQRLPQHTANGGNYSIFNGNATVSPQFLRSALQNTGTLKNCTVERFTKANNEVIIGGPPLPNFEQSKNLNKSKLCDDQGSLLYGQVGNYNMYGAYNGVKPKNHETSSLVSYSVTNNNNHGKCNNRNSKMHSTASDIYENENTDCRPNGNFSNSYTRAKKFADKCPTFHAVDLKSRNTKSIPFHNAEKIVSFNNKKNSNSYKMNDGNIDTLTKSLVSVRNDTFSSNKIAETPYDNYKNSENFTAINVSLNPIKATTTMLLTPSTTTTSDLAVMSQDNTATNNLTSKTYTESYKFTGTTQHQPNEYYDNYISDLSKNNDKKLKPNEINYAKFDYSEQIQTLTNNYQEMPKNVSNQLPCTQLNGMDNKIDIQNNKLLSSKIQTENFIQNNFLNVGAKRKIVNAYATSVV